MYKVLTLINIALMCSDKYVDIFNCSLKSEENSLIPSKEYGAQKKPLGTWSLPFLVSHWGANARIS